MSDSPIGCVYEIDENNRLVAAGPEWDDFALANDGADVVFDRVVGRDLFELIVGDEVRYIYEQMLKSVRTSGARHYFEFRCDGPTQRRRLSMAIRDAGGGHVGFETRVLEVRPRPAVSLLDRAASRGPKLVRVCAWCARVRAGADWLDLDEAIGVHDLFDQPQVPRMSHGICGDCHARALAML
jgi:hypothetical protein